MKDFLHNDLHIGDKIIMLRSTKTSSWLKVSEVKGFTKFYVRTSDGIVSPEKVLRIKSLNKHNEEQ